MDEKLARQSLEERLAEIIAEVGVPFSEQSQRALHQAVERLIETVLEQLAVQAADGTSWYAVWLESEVCLALTQPEKEAVKTPEELTALLRSKLITELSAKLQSGQFEFGYEQCSEDDCWSAAE